MKLGLLLLLAACTPPAVPPTPDASDAASAPDSGGVCASACATFASFCGPQPPTCLDAMTKLSADRQIRSPSGAPVTCACIAAAASVAALTACGVECGP